jgi:hypothetical protein
MSMNEQQVERLRAAFATLADGQVGGEDLPDPEIIWRAVHGELPPGETAALVERAARCPQTAEAWRLARQLAAEVEPAQPARITRFPIRQRWVLALAATIVVAVATPLLLRSPHRPVFREGPGVTIETTIEESQPLPRDAFLLRWTPLRPGATYRIFVADQDLEPVFEAADLDEPTFLVPSPSLARLPAGALVLWRVEATLPDGSTVRSATFSHRIE